MKKQCDNKQQVNIRNKRAWRDYELIEKVEAGLVLTGSEVKSLRNSQGELEGSFVRIRNSQCWLTGCKIAHYPQAGIFNHEPVRDRKLLLHKKQIAKLQTKLDQRGFTLIPLRLYFNSRGYAKAEIAVAKGKRKYDKRQDLITQQQKRDVARDMKKFKR